jgi:antitoxin CptB
MRSWRRGTREMDLILGPWADAHLAALAEGDLTLYDALLAENDQDLYQWFTRPDAVPDRYRLLVAHIAEGRGL